MASLPLDVVVSIETDSSSGSERILTPTLTVPSGSRYASQHNVTPTPEPTDQRVAGFFAQLQISDEALEPAQGNVESLAEGIDQLVIHADHASDVSNDDFGYNMRTESLPNAPIYDVRLQGALRSTKAELGRLLSIMRGCPLVSDTSSTISALSQQTRRLSEFEYPRTRTIGMVGDSGVGKSSLINSLLDEECIARSSCDGGACTNIVTEYRYLSGAERRGYYFEVDYMSSEEVKVLLEDLVCSYRAYHTDAFREIRSVAERDAVMDKASKAASALRSLFEDVPAFTEDMLLGEDPYATQEILGSLENMVRDIQGRRPGGLTASVWSGSATTSDDLMDQLNVFIREHSDDGIPVLWPFVGIIRIYLKSLFLRTGIILADLPGLRDLNYARVRATDRYMRSCHEIFAVTKIDRASTDVGVQDIIRQFSERPIRVVCTHSEAVNAKETERMSPQDAPYIRTLRSATTRLEREQKHCRRARNLRSRNAQHQPGADDSAQASEELRIGDELEEARFRLNSFLIERRNTKIRRELQARYSEQVLDRDLQVFCVSNTLYSKYKNEELAVSQQIVELSAIPALRQYCHLIPAAAQFKAVAAYLGSQVPALLGSIQQWLVQGSDGLSAERADAVRAVLDTSTRHFQQSNQLLDCRGMPLTEVDIGQGTYAAFCRNYGEHSTAAVGYINWNAEIASTMQNDLEPRWTTFIEGANGDVEDTTRAIGRIFDIEENNMLGCREFAPNSIDNLIANMTPRLSCITDIFDTSVDDFNEKIALLQNEALGGHASSYMTGLMRPTYVACQSESGTGSDNRRKGHIARRLAQPTLFLEARSLARDAERELVRALIEEMRNKLRPEFEQLVVDIQSVVGEEGEVSESRRHPDIARQMDRAVGALTQALDAHRDLLSQLRSQRARST